MAWPHESILGGVNRQRVMYDQLTLTQWVQGFLKNILEESCNERKDIMVSYLSDLMVDATDFSWQGAKAAHAVLLCELERGSLQWEYMDQMDQIRRAHAQKHVPGRGSWLKPSDPGRKPWFCKSYQTGVCTHSRDHESNGKLQKHICAYCLMGGRRLTHPEKDCNFKTQSAKNEQTQIVSGGSAAESSQTTAGRTEVNDGVIGSENMIVSNVSDYGERRHVTKFFHNSAVKPEEVSTLMARKFKNVTATFHERFKTKVFG